MADYIYLLENRLSPPQRLALRSVVEMARARSLTVFLVGGAVRDLTSGSPVRSLDMVVQGKALELEASVVEAGAVLLGRAPAEQLLFARFPGGVRVEIGSTLKITYPKPGQPVFEPAAILDDLRRRDFTANAMALSLNEGSFGLLMDPMNGVADIENRELRLVSNYGFIEDPVRMIRAVRLQARLGWSLEERTEARYQTGKDEGYIEAMGGFERGLETEEIVHEDDALQVLTRLEAEGWMAHLAPYWTAAKVNVPEFERLREVARQLEVQGIHPDLGAASFPLLTAKLSAKDVAELKRSFPRQGFVAEIEALEGQAKELSAQLSAKGAAAPSQTWKLLRAAAPEAVLWLAFSSRSPAIQAKLKSFGAEWPQARQKIPYALLQEMRIVPELPVYEELVETLFFALMDGRLGTTDEMRAFLEPYSPPAPPPPVNARKLRTPRKESKPARAKIRKPAEDEDEDEAELESIAEEVVEALGAGTESAATATATPAAMIAPIPSPVAVPSKAEERTSESKKPADAKTAAAESSAAVLKPIASRPVEPGGASAKAVVAKTNPARVEPPAVQPKAAKAGKGSAVVPAPSAQDRRARTPEKTISAPPSQRLSERKPLKTHVASAPAPAAKPAKALPVKAAEKKPEQKKAKPPAKPAPTVPAPKKSAAPAPVRRSIAPAKPAAKAPAKQTVPVVANAVRRPAKAPAPAPMRKVAAKGSSRGGRGA